MSFFDVIKHGTAQSEDEILSKIISLHAQGADVNEFNGLYETPLMIACVDAFPKVVEWLIQNGANVNEFDGRSYSAMLYALKSDTIEHQHCVQLLLNGGYNINQTDEFHNTALHIAITIRNLGYVKLLIEHGARCDIINYVNQTAYEAARLNHINYPLDQRCRSIYIYMKSFPIAIENCRNAIIHILLIRQFRTDECVIDMLHTDVFENIIVRMIWESRFDVETWIHTNTESDLKKIKI